METKKTIEETLQKTLQEMFESESYISKMQEIKKVETDEDYKFKVVVTSEAVDRDWEIIRADGIDTSKYMTNPVVLVNHEYKVESIVWKTLLLYKENGKTIAEWVFAKWVEKAELIRALYNQWMIKTVSIWFIPTKRNVNDGRIIEKSEMLEFSFVAVPANPEALSLDWKVYQKCVEAWLIKEEKQEEKLLASQVNIWDNIAFRRVSRYTNALWIEQVEIYPDLKSLPYLGKVLAKYENGENLLNWWETLISWDSKNPLLVVQTYVKSKDGPILMTTNVNLWESSRMMIDSVVSQKEIEDVEMKCAACDEDFDKKEILHNIKSVWESVKALEQKFTDLVNDKTELETLEKSRKMWQELAKSLSTFLQGAKKVTQ